MLLSVVVVEQAMAILGARSALALERKLESETDRSEISSQPHEGRARKWRSGQHIASPYWSRRLASKCPDIARTKESSLWGLLARLPSEPVIEAIFLQLDPRVFGLTHHAMYMIHIREWIPRLPPDTSMFERLVAVRCWDGLAALIALMQEALLKSDTQLALQVGRYIPLALAMLQTTPEGYRVAVLMFACLRKYALDALEHDGQQLRLADYDLSRAARYAPVDALPVYSARGTLDQSYKQCWPEMPETLVSWMIRFFPPLRPAGITNGRHWVTDLEPAVLCKKLAFHASAITVFRAELGDYFDAPGRMRRRCRRNTTLLGLPHPDRHTKILIGVL